MYPKSKFQTIELKYPLTLLAILIGILLCAIQIPKAAAPAPISDWRVVKIARNGETAHPLHAPVLLDNALIWRRLGANQLIFSSLDGHIRQPYNWLGGVPLEWAAHQTEQQIYLLWKSELNELWVALLSPTGDQLTAPIRVATEVDQFKSVLLENNQVGVIWLAQQTPYFRIIDTQGRPLPETALDIIAHDIALMTDSSDHLTLAWRDGNTLWVGDIIEGQLDNRQSVAELPVDHWLSDLESFRRDNERVLIWGTTNPQQPDRENYQGLIFPKDQFESPRPFIFALESLRWLTVDQQSGRLAAAALIDGAWQTVLMDSDGYQIVDGAAITGSPPALNGEHMAWVSLDLTAQPRLYVTTQDEHFGELRYPPDNFNWRQTIKDGLKNSPYMLLCLIAPALCAVLLRHRPYQLPATMAVYWLGKWLIPLGLFSVYPATLKKIGFDSPFLTGAIALFTISGMAALVAYVGWGRTSHTIRHAAFFLTDAFLTFAIFGAAVE